MHVVLMHFVGYRSRNVSTSSIRRIQGYTMIIVKSKGKEIHYKQPQLVYIYIYLDGGGYLDTKSRTKAERVYIISRTK